MKLGKEKATITAIVYVNGNPVKVRPNEFTVTDGDELRINLDVEIPVVQRDDTVGGVTIARVVEIIEPKVEA